MGASTFLHLVMAFVSMYVGEINQQADDATPWLVVFVQLLDPELRARFAARYGAEPDAKAKQIVTATGIKPA